MASSSIPFNSLLSSSSSGETIRDYQHASKLFVDSLYRLAPKYSFLFHVFFDINPVALQLAASAASQSGRASIDVTKQIEIGMLAKSAQLPKFTIKNKTYNSYNRKNIVQDAVQYDPITISLHDDNADVVRSFWADYYSYYYRDGDYEEPAYQQTYKYQLRPYKYWGFSPRSSVPYLARVRIYSLHQQHFSSYTLINPLIQSFKHGDHQQGQNETLQHDVTIAYESVVYLSGPVSNGVVQGFGDIHYDRTPSPLSPVNLGTNTGFGPSGLFGGLTSPPQNLTSGNYYGQTSPFSAPMNTPATQASAFGPSLSQLASSVLSSQNPLSSVFAPTAASLTSIINSAFSSPAAGKTASTGSLVNMNNNSLF